MTLMAKLQAAADQTTLQSTEAAFHDILKVQRYLRLHRLPAGRPVMAPTKIKSGLNSLQLPLSGVEVEGLVLTARPSCPSLITGHDAQPFSDLAQLSTLQYLARSADELGWHSLEDDWQGQAVLNALPRLQAAHTALVTCVVMAALALCVYAKLDIGGAVERTQAVQQATVQQATVQQFMSLGRWLLLSFVACSGFYAVIHWQLQSQKIRLLQRWIDAQAFPEERL